MIKLSNQILHRLIFFFVLMALSLNALGQTNTFTSNVKMIIYLEAKDDLHNIGFLKPHSVLTAELNWRLDSLGQLDATVPEKERVRFVREVYDLKGDLFKPDFMVKYFKFDDDSTFMNKWEMSIMYSIHRPQQQFYELQFGVIFELEQANNGEYSFNCVERSDVAVCGGIAQHYYRSLEDERKKMYIQITSGIAGL